MRVGQLKLRDRITKERLGIITVDRAPSDVVHVRIDFGHPEIELEIAPDIAIALADLLMESTAPNKRKQG